LRNRHDHASGAVKKTLFINNHLKAKRRPDHMIILINTDQNNQKDQLFKNNKFLFIYDHFFFMLLEP
ncbi:hypothetical protein, partial [Vibrio sp. V26_P1S5P106]|uniref:hypothetical protein n=1 Tax=Vibrio sp. V26_P1S5P106 TaxID=1938678 RepID=UPI001F258002